MLRIVLADDNVRTAEGLARSIDYAALGYHLSGVAHNGKQALDLALEHRANVVITDVRMPIMDGLELSRRLRLALPGVCIIILSAYDDFEYARAALTTGVEDYVLKPLDKAKLQGIVDILGGVRERLRRRAAVLTRLGDARAQKQIEGWLECSDPEVIRRDVSELLADCGADHACAMDTATRVLSLLWERAAHTTQSVQEPALERILQDLATETDVAGVKRCLCAAAMEMSRAVSAARRETGRGVIGAITEYIDAHYHESALTVRSLLARYRVSASWLHQAFKAHNGTTPNAYITDRRMGHARELLEGGKAGVAETARRSGYRDAHYFGRVFRKRYGLSPAEHRRRALGRTGA